MKLYGSTTSACTHKPLTVLAEKGHQVELVEVDVLEGEDKRPEHRALQPFGEIPVLDDDGFVLYESRAIIRYLDARLPGPALTPDDLRQRGLMEQWISVEQSCLSGPVWDIVRGGPVYDLIRESPAADLFPPRPDGATLSAAREAVDEVLDVVEGVLAEQEYLTAFGFSLAEVSWMPYLEYLLASGGGGAVAARPNVAAWWERISTRPSWAAVGKVLTSVD